MSGAAHQTNEELMAELNADLRARDPLQIMKRQMRLRALDEIRQRVAERRLADTNRADFYVQVEAIIEDLERTAPA